MRFISKAILIQKLIIAMIGCVGFGLAQHSDASPVSASEHVTAKNSGTFAYNQQPINYQFEVLADQLNHPWSLAFLPNNGYLISQRNGELRQLIDGELLAPVSAMPEVLVMGQAGLFDVVLHPDFVNNRKLFLSYANGTQKANSTRVISAKLIDNTLIDSKVIFDSVPLKDTPVHFGGRMVILPDNTLLLTTGDGFDYREKAQDLSGLLGKVIRINLDGSIPIDNPFANDKKARPEIFSYGHRNPQGLIFDQQRHQIFLHEHGPKGGDEINLIQPGNNYGWPVITYGKDYSGASISPFTEYPNMQQPLLNWTPSIAPSGMAVYYGQQFAELNGDFLVGALVDREVRLVQMEGASVRAQVSLFKQLNARIRDVRVGQQGAIYLLTDSDNGQLIKVSRVFSNVSGKR